jgi:hypothetical protein
VITARYAQVDLPASCTWELVSVLDRAHDYFGALGEHAADAVADAVAVEGLRAELRRAARRVGWEIR